KFVHVLARWLSMNVSGSLGHCGNRFSVGIGLFFFRLNRCLVKPEVGSRWKNAPGIGRMGIIRKMTDFVIGGQLFQVTEKFDEVFLLHHTKIAKQIACRTMASGAPDQMPTILGQMI